MPLLPPRTFMAILATAVLSTNVFAKPRPVATPENTEAAAIQAKVSGLKNASGCQVDAGTPVQRARDLVFSEKMDDAVALVKSSESAMQSSECLAEFLSLGAVAAYADQQYPQAIAFLQQLITDVPLSKLRPRAYYEIGGTQYALGHFDDAKTTYEALVQASPETPEAKAAQVKIYDCDFHAGRFPEALAGALKHSKDHPGDPRLIYVCKTLLQEVSKGRNTASSEERGALERCAYNSPFAPGMSLH